MRILQNVSSIIIYVFKKMYVNTQISLKRKTRAKNAIKIQKLSITS